MTHPIIFIMGVTGSGKTTVGEWLAAKTGIPFFDADDFHPEKNISKMKSGQPLTDDDRIPWLQRLNELARSVVNEKGVIIACSALKESYRLQLSAGLEKVYWIFLQGDFEIIANRLKQRKGHFMPPALLQSQFDALEIPADAFTVNIDRTVEQVGMDIISYLNRG